MSTDQSYTVAQSGAAPIKAQNLPHGLRNMLDDQKGNPQGSNKPAGVKTNQAPNNKAEVLEKPQKPEWACSVVSQPQNAEKGFTVGEIFTLSCQGSELDLQEPLSIQLAEEKQYSVVLLKKLELTKNKISYEATSYRTGNVELPFLHVVDGKNGGFVSQPFQLKVGSVMPNPPPESIYGPAAPVSVSWPIWILFVVGLMFVVLLGWFLVFLKQRMQRKNLEKNIRKFLSPMGSYQQFCKDIRVLRTGVLFSDRQAWTVEQVHVYLERLNEHFRMFLLREFTIPATTWSSRLTQKEIRKKSKLSYVHYQELLNKSFNELDRALGAPEKVTSKDCEQLTKIVMKTVDEVWFKKNKGKKR